jgi:hypothetical protein
MIPRRPAEPSVCQAMRRTWYAEGVVEPPDRDGFRTENPCSPADGNQSLKAIHQSSSLLNLTA